MPYPNYVSQETGADAFAANAGYMEYGSDKISTVGSFPFRVDGNGNVTCKSLSTGTPGSASPTLALQAATPVAGVALINGTQNIITWTAPNDGLLHRVLVFINASVTVSETGGACGTSITSPDGTTHVPGTLGGGSTAGSLPNVTQSLFVKAGTTVTVQQTSALTAGTAVVWADIWAS